MKKFVFLATFICCELYSTDDLINSLNEITKIATKTKLNVDYVPGLVSVVYGKDLKRAGITNLTAQNAFDVILGMESVVSSIRGVGSWYGANGNKIKWMINDIAIETELRETDDWAKGHVFLPISVDNIDRIEVIRGSASATYGGNAMFGVVNIITKKDITGGTVAFEQLGNGHYSKQISAFTNVKSDDFSLDLSISKLDSDGYNLYVGADGHFFSDFDGSRQWFGYGPGKLPLYLQGYSIMADLDYKDYKFWVYKFNTQTGQGYDWIPTDFFPPYNNDIYCKTSDILLVGMQKKYDLTENLSFTPKINYTQYSNPAYYLKYTSDLFETKWLNNKTYPLEDGYRYRKYKEQKVNVEADFEYKLDIHSFLIGLYTQQTKILKDETYRNYVFNEGLTDGFYYYDKLLNRPENPEDRTQKAVFFQDYVDITDWLSLTIGARYDDFSDIGNELSPRLATVFRIDDINILKFQISRAFRPPTFYENYGYMSLNKLNPETVDTIETSYIYNDKTKTFRVTLFDSNIKNMITQDYNSYYFINLKDEAKLSGVELEFKMLADFAEFGINSAFYNSKNRQTGNEFALSASYMGNIFLTFNPKSDYSTSFWYRYISKKPRLEDSSNGYIPAQDYLNITQAFENIVKNGDLHVGVRNIFDEVQTTLYAPLNPQNYDDIPYMRRSFWINFSYRF